jgi:hypothetical protein
MSDDFYSIKMFKGHFLAKNILLEKFVHNLYANINPDPDPDPDGLKNFIRIWIRTKIVNKLSRTAPLLLS